MLLRATLLPKVFKLVDSQGLSREALLSPLSWGVETPFSATDSFPGLFLHDVSIDIPLTFPQGMQD